MVEARFEIERVPRLGIKGPGCDRWLQAMALPVPDAVFKHLPIDGGRLFRVGTSEYVVEGTQVEAVRARYERDEPKDVYLVDCQHVTIRVAGNDRRLVFEQVCGLNPDELEPDKVYFTRAAGASVALSVTEQQDEYAVDPSLAIYLEEVFRDIVGDL